MIILAGVCNVQDLKAAAGNVKATFKNVCVDVLNALCSCVSLCVGVCACL